MRACLNKGAYIKVVDEYMVSVDQVVTAAHVAKHRPGANDRAVSLTAEQTLRFAQAVVDGMFAKDDDIVKYTHNGYLKRWYTLPTPYKARGVCSTPQ